MTKRNQPITLLGYLYFFEKCHFVSQKKNNCALRLELELGLTEIRFRSNAF